MKRTAGSCRAHRTSDASSRGGREPIDLEIGPGGDLFYVDLGGTVRRVSTWRAANRPPTAVAEANPTRAVTRRSPSAFDGTGSSDPDGDTLAYAWDLDGDGEYDDSTARARPGPTTALATTWRRSRSRDALGASDTDSVTIHVGGPRVAINAPASGTTWAVGSTISFSGSAADNRGQPIPPSGLSWSLVLHHGVCPLCHDHPLQTINGVSSGSFIAPEHEYPASLELSLTATDTAGLKGTEERGAATADHDLDAAVAALRADAGAERIHGADAVQPDGDPGSRNTLSAPSPQTLRGKWRWVSWSDGGAQTHDVIAPSGRAHLHRRPT